MNWFSIKNKMTPSKGKEVIISMEEIEKGREKTRDQLDSEEWMPDVKTSEWIPGVHPDMLEFNGMLRKIRMASLGVLVSSVIYLIAFCIVTFLVNLVFSSNVTLFLFGVENINPLHVIGFYVSYFIFKTVARFIDDEFSGFDFFPEPKESELFANTKPQGDVNTDEVILGLRKLVRKQEQAIKKIKNN